GEPAARSGRPAAGPGTAGPGPGPCGRGVEAPRARKKRGLGSLGKDVGQLVWRGDVELIVAAVVRCLVRAPAQEHRGVAEAVALQVIVLDLADALDPERLPGQILLRAPAAPHARHPAEGGGVHLGPVAPRMT